MAQDLLVHDGAAAHRALIGSSGSADLAALSRFGLFLGAAFQITDDILNLTAAWKHGKEIGGDLREGKQR